MHDLLQAWQNLGTSAQLQEGAEGLHVQLNIEARPKSSRDKIILRKNGNLKIMLHAPAVEGKANEALIALLAKRCGVAPREVCLVRGDKRKAKVIRIDYYFSAHKDAAYYAAKLAQLIDACEGDNEEGLKN